MFKLTLVFTAAFLFAVSAAQNDESIEELNLYETDKVLPYDMVVLAQSWPQSSCWNLNKKWQETSCSPCKMPKAKTSWTLHGLWPSSRSGKHPFNCNNSQKFNPNLLSSALRTQLEEKWLSFNLKMNNQMFWTHEWKKHGTCAQNLESTNSLPKYFSHSVKMLDLYNMGTIFTKLGILPGRKYAYDDFIGAIESTYGVKVHMECAMNTVSKEQYLVEIQICFDKSFKLTNCDDVVTGNCNRNKQIMYPINLPSCK